MTGTTPNIITMPMQDITDKQRAEAIEILSECGKRLTSFARILNEVQEIPPHRRRMIPEAQKDVIIEELGRFADTLRNLSGPVGTDGEPEMTRIMRAIFILSGLSDDLLRGDLVRRDA
jgi:hypothetical protein